MDRAGQGLAGGALIGRVVRLRQHHFWVWVYRLRNWQPLRVMAAMLIPAVFKKSRLFMFYSPVRGSFSARTGPCQQ